MRFAALIFWAALFCTAPSARAAEGFPLELNAFAGVGGMFLPQAGSVNTAFSAKVFFQGDYFLKPWAEAASQTYFTETPRGQGAVSSGLSIQGGGSLNVWRLRLRGGIGVTQLRMANASTGLAAIEWDVSTMLGMAVKILDLGAWQLWSDFRLENIEVAGITSAYGGVSVSFFPF